MSHRWLVVGAGVSGLGAAQLLAKRGEFVRVTERSRLPIGKADAFINAGIELCDGGHQLSHLDGITDLVISPGLPPSHPLLVEARRRGLPMLSEIDLALASYKGQVIAVTGTNGKSTTCAMIGLLLERIGRGVTVGGNFGDPPSAMLAEGREKDYLVLELSSYQLEQSELVAPVVALFTSFSFDHLARHGSLGGYLAAKWRIFAHMSKNSKAPLALVPLGILELARKEGLADPAGLVIVYDSEEAAAKAKTPAIAVANGTLFMDQHRTPLAGIPEVHNQLNAALSIVTVMHLTGRTADELAPLLEDFRGLPHRCELIGRRQGKPVINDSKSTNLESTLVALASQQAPVLLMMGGQGKGEPYSPLLIEKDKIAALITFGASGPEIAAAVKNAFPILSFPTLTAALGAISGILETYDLGLLFSPACASFDEFDNYSHRGEVFKSAMDPMLDVRI